MRSYFKYSFIIALVVILGLFIWNYFLISDLKATRSELKEVELKKQMLEGDVHVLNYDLTTSRDSVRILNKLLEMEKE